MTGNLARLGASAILSCWIALGAGLMAQSPHSQPTSATSALSARVLDHLQADLMLRGEPYRQSIAALRLVQGQGTAAAMVVRKGLGDSTRPDVRLALLAAVQSEGNVRYIGAVVKLLSSVDEKIAGRAIEVLGELPSRDVLPHLVRVVSAPSSPANERSRSIRAMGATLDPVAVKELLPALKDASPQVRSAAAEALARITGHDLGLDSSKWEAWWQAHGKQSAEQLLLRQLRRMVRRQKEEARLADQAERAVLKLHRRLLSVLSEGERVAHIIEMGRSEFASVRALAAELAAQQVKKSANGAEGQPSRAQLTALLLRGCDDVSAEVRAQSSRGLGAAGDVEALPKLLALLDDPEPSVKAAAARSLGLLAFGSGPKAGELRRRAGAALLALLDGQPPELIAAAAHSLGLLAATEAVPALVRLLPTTRPDQVRVEAAQALETVATTEALTALYLALKDKEVAVRFSAVGALKRLASDPKLPAATRGRMAQELITVLNKDPDAGVRARAANAIGIIDGPDVLEPLWECLSRQEVDQVKVKTWEAMSGVILSHADVGLLMQWEGRLAKARQHDRRCELLRRALTQWAQQKDPPRPASEARQLTERLTVAYLDAGAWQSAFPLARELLGRDNPGDRRITYVNWVLRACEMAIEPGRPEEVLEQLRAVQSRIPEGNKALTDRCASLLTRAERAAEQKSKQRLQSLVAALEHLRGKDPAQKETAKNLIKLNWREARELILSRLASTDVNVRSQAKAALAVYLGQKIDFNPQADDGTRARQLQALDATLRK